MIKVEGPSYVKKNKVYKLNPKFQHNRGAKTEVWSFAYDVLKESKENLKEKKSYISVSKTLH